MDLVHLAATNPVTNLPQKLVTNPATGALVVDSKATIATDLSVIEGNLSTIASDLAVGIIAGVPSVKMTDGVGNALTSTTLSGGHQALDVNIVGSSGGGGGASAAYNASLPTYTSGQSTTLQTDANGRLITANPSALPLPTGAATAANQSSEITALNQLHSDLIAALPAGTNVIGKVGIDQTTPGTTNAVSVGSSISALPLPTGAATSALQTTGNSSLSTIATNTGNIPSPVSGRLPVDGSGVTQPVSASSLPLPTGAATSALQTTGNSSLSTIATNTGNIPSPVSGRLPVDGSGVTQPVSAASLPLPAGAAKESGGNLDTIVTKETAIAAVAGTTADSAWTSGAGTLVALGKAIVNAINAALPAGSNTIGNVNVLGGNATAVKVDGSAVTQPASIADGSDAAQGAKADAAYAGSGSASIVSVLKGIYASLVAALPAGSNKIGGVTIADGDNSSQGAKADSAANNSTSSWSIIALLKGIYALCAAATPAGTNNIGTVGVVNGSNTLAIDSNGYPTVNNAPLGVYNYTATGAVSAGTVIIGPIDCSLIREVSVQCVVAGTGAAYTAWVSNNNSTWTQASIFRLDGTISNNGVVSGTAGVITYVHTGATRYFQLTMSSAQTAGTSTLVAYASQQSTPKLFQSLVGTPSVQVTTGTPIPSTSTGFAAYHTLISAATTNATNVKNSQGAIGSLFLTNTSASFKYFKLCNNSIAPTPGTTTPVLNIAIPPSTSINFETAFAGLRMSTGISYMITGGQALLDATAVAAGDVVVCLTYA